MERFEARTKGDLKVRGMAGYAGHGINDINGRSVFSIPSNGTRELKERDANAAFAVHAWKNHDPLVKALTEAIIAMTANGAPKATIEKLAATLADAIA